MCVFCVVLFGLLVLFVFSVFVWVQFWVVFCCFPRGEVFIDFLRC